AIGIDAYDLEVFDGAALHAHVAGHALALEHATRGLALADGAGRTVRHGHAVRGRQTAEVVTLHGAREALARGGAGDVHDLADGEQVDLELAASGQVRALAVGEAELDQGLAGGDLDLGVVAREGLADVGSLAGAEGDLQRTIAVVLGGTNLRNAV